MSRELSICIANYNNAQYIARCIESFINSYEQSQKLIKFEIIIVDDGSKDQSLSVIAKVMRTYPEYNIRLIKHLDNQSVLRARKTGYLNAKYQYLHFFDPDDYVYQTYFSTIEKYDFNFDILAFDAKRSDELVNLKIMDQLPIAFEYVWNKIINKDLLDGLKAIRLNLHDDTYINYRYLLRNANLEKCHYINQVLVEYFQNDASLIYKDLIITWKQYQEHFRNDKDLFKKLWIILNYSEDLSKVKKDALAKYLKQFIDIANYWENFDKDVYDNFFANNSIYQACDFDVKLHKNRSLGYFIYRKLKNNLWYYSLDIISKVKHDNG